MYFGSFRGGAEVSKMRSHSGDRYADVPCQEPDAPHSRPSAWEDSILATSQAICRRWGSDGGMDEWSDDRPQQQAPARNRHRRRMSDTGRMSEWSKSTPANEKLERYVKPCSDRVLNSFKNVIDRFLIFKCV